MHALRSLALTALTVLLLTPSTDAKVFQDPTGTGSTDGGIAVLPTDNTLVVLNIFLDDGNTASPSGVCETGIGDESCGGDLELTATGAAEIVSIANPASGDVISNQTGPLRALANWLDPTAPTTAPKPLLIATVRASGPGEILFASASVKANLTLASDSGVLAATAAVADGDSDGVPDGDDNCPFVPNGAGEAVGQPTWGQQAESTQYPGVGCACLCGDPNRDCSIDAFDSPEAQRRGLTPPLAPISPFFDVDFCDINQDGICDAFDSPEMQRAGLFGLGPISPNFSVTGCLGYQGL